MIKHGLMLRVTDAKDQTIKLVNWLVNGNHG